MNLYHLLFAFLLVTHVNPTENQMDEESSIATSELSTSDSWISDTSSNWSSIDDSSDASMKDGSSLLSSASSNGPLPPISTGRSASQTLRAAKASKPYFTAMHNKMPPGPTTAGLEQETALVYSWKQTRTLILNMGVQKKMARSLQREVKVAKPGGPNNFPNDRIGLARLRSSKARGKKRHTPGNKELLQKEVELEAGEGAYDQMEAQDDKSSHLLPITIPHGFQLMRTMLQPKPIKSVINVSANNTDTFAVLDTYYAQLFRGNVKVARISVGEEKGIPDSHLTGLNRWFYVKKWRCTVIATLHLELKVLGLSLEVLSQTSSIKPVLSLDFHDERDELIAGGVGNIRIWTFSKSKGTYRLLGPRLVIDDLATEEWISHTVVNKQLNRLIAACDCDILVYDYATGRRIDRLRNVHELSINVMIFYTPHQYLITGSKDSSIKVWTRYTLFVLELKSHTNSPVTGLAVANPEESESKIQTFLISSYLDGAIRMWSLDSGQCVYKHETNNECLGLDWLRTDVFFHYAKDRLCVWNLNRHYTAFSSINSSVTSIARIDIPGFPPRILVTCADAAIKLLSPVTGACLLTAFPVIRDSTIRSVEYDIVSNMLWVLTTVGDVFIYSTICNPCKVVDEWRSQAGRDLVTCMTALRVKPKNGKRSLTNLKAPTVYTLFGGTETGQIVTMDIRKRGGEVNTLIQAHSSKMSAISCCSEKMQVISAGYDGFVKLWSISWTETMDSTVIDEESPDLCLQLQPFSTLSTYSVAQMPKGFATIISWNINAETAAFSSNLSPLTLFNWNERGLSETRRKHPADEDHLKPVSGISSLAQLQIFSTSSDDGTIKIWDAEMNSLVREIQFNEPICSVCFNNPRGDLLVGLASHLVLVRVHDYLPNQYLADLMNLNDNWEDDPIESPKMFDSELDFWELYRIGLERIGADLTRWHVRFTTKSQDEDKITAQIKDLERRKHDADEQRKRALRLEKKRRRQLRHMTVDEQKQLLLSLGLLDSLDVNLSDLMRKGRNLEALLPADALQGLSVLEKFLDDKIEEEQKVKQLMLAEMKRTGTRNTGNVERKKSKNIYEKQLKNNPKRFEKPNTPVREKKEEKADPSASRKKSLVVSPKARIIVPITSVKKQQPSIKFKLEQVAKTTVLAEVLSAPPPPKSKSIFPGKSKQWIQDYFSKLGLLPNSIMMGSVVEDKLRRERLLREQKAAADKLAATNSALDQRLLTIKNNRSMMSMNKAGSFSSTFSDDSLPSLKKGVFEAIDLNDDNDSVDMTTAINAQIQDERKEAAGDNGMSEDERLRLEELEREKKALHEKQLAETKARREEEDRYERMRQELEEADRRRKREEIDAKRKAELDEKLAKKRAKRAEIEAAKAAKKAEEEEAARLKAEKEEEHKRRRSTMKDFVPVIPDSEKVTVAMDIFTSRDKRGSLYQAPTQFVPKKIARKPIVPFKRRERKFETIDSVIHEETSVASNLSNSQVFDPNILDPKWDPGEDLEMIVAQNAWFLIERSKSEQAKVGESNTREEFNNVMNAFWFPGLNGKEVNLKNIVEVLFTIMRKGYWKEKVEASKSLLYLFQTFQSDFINPIEFVILPMLELFNDSDWQFRVTLCTVITSFNVSHSEIVYILISKLADQHDQVRKAAKAALAKLGIDSRDSLKKAMISLQLIPNSEATDATTFLDDQINQIKRVEGEQVAITNEEVESWRARIPPKKIPGSLSGRPSSYNATLVFSGVHASHNDYSNIWIPFRKMRNSMVVPPAAEKKGAPSKYRTTGPVPTRQAIQSITKGANCSNRISIVQIGSHRNSYDFNSGEAMQVSRHASLRPTSSMQPYRSSTVGFRGGAANKDEKEGNSHSSSVNTSHLSLDTDIYPRYSVTRQTNIPSHVITFNGKGVQKPVVKSAKRKMQPANGKEPNDNQYTDEDTFSLYAKAYINSRRATAIYEHRGGVVPIAPHKPIAPSQWSATSEIQDILADPWSSVTKPVVVPRKNSVTSGPLITRQPSADDEEVLAEDDEGIKIYSRRVSMQPVQVNYYRRIGPTATRDHDQASKTLPPLVPPPETIPEEANATNSKRPSTDYSVPVVPVRLRTAEESAIRPNHSFLVTSAGGTPKRNTITAATTLYESRPWTMEGERVSTAESNGKRRGNSGHIPDANKKTNLDTSNELSVKGWSDGISSTS
ncbi:hypothetical protein BC830DRAFT_1214475 [Chytriomyces sp. MP71]|nr:hypothetical protein BC830DRAFT_1214475 [Chytriomyces sp. MP71]